MFLKWGLNDCLDGECFCFKTQFFKNTSVPADLALEGIIKQELQEILLDILIIIWTFA